MSCTCPTPCYNRYIGETHKTLLEKNSMKKKVTKKPKQGEAQMFYQNFQNSIDTYYKNLNKFVNSKKK